MRIHRPGLLKAFWNQHPDAECFLRAWFEEARNASWSTPAELKRQFLGISMLANGRVIFDVCGNKYRLVASVDYEAKIVMLRWIGTHADYQGIAAEGG